MSARERQSGRARERGKVGRFFLAAANHFSLCSGLRTERLSDRKKARKPACLQQKKNRKKKLGLRGALLFLSSTELSKKDSGERRKEKESVRGLSGRENACKAEAALRLGLGLSGSLPSGYSPTTHSSSAWLDWAQPPPTHLPSLPNEPSHPLPDSASSGFTVSPCLELWTSSVMEGGR